MQTYWLEQTAADLPANDDWLSSREILFFGSLRFAKRRADWRLGRWTAKLAAAAYLNLSPDAHCLREIEVRAAPSGAPELSLRNRPAALSISLSHRAEVAICAIADCDAALGCDLELIEPRDENFLADYFTREEQAWVARVPVQQRPELVTLLWSAKESTLKALAEGLRLDTRSLAVTLGEQPDRNDAALPWQPLQVRCASGKVFHGWWRSTGQLVRTLVALPSSLPPVLLKACAAFAMTA